MGIHVIDTGIILVYFVAVIGIGFALMRRASKDLDAYFLGGYSLPWWMLGLSNASSMWDIAGTMWISEQTFFKKSLNIMKIQVQNSVFSDRKRLNMPMRHMKCLQTIILILSSGLATALASQELPVRDESLVPFTRLDEAAATLLDERDLLPWEADSLVSGDMATSPWFGDFMIGENDWHLHLNLGWVWVGSVESPDNMWMYSTSRNSWIWTGKDIFPITYEAASASWITFFTIEDGGVWLFDFDSGEWILNPVLRFTLDYTAAAPLGIPGSQPAVAVADDDTVHLLYVNGNRLLHRELSADFVPGPEAVVLTLDVPELSSEFLHKPIIVLDKNGDPHAAVSDGHTYNPNTFYSNRIGDSWAEPIVVWNNSDRGTGRSTMPSLAIDNDLTAYIGVFTYGDINPLRWMGGLIKVDNSTGDPVVTQQKYCKPWVPQVMLRGEELWVGGRIDTRWKIQRYSKETVTALGDVIDVSKTRIGEANIGVVDHLGRLHFAGADLLTNPATAGWYSTFDRVTASRSPVRFHTTMHNPCGMVMPVVDRVNPDHVYLFHWSDDSSKPEETKDCTPVRVALFDNGTRVSDNIVLDADPSRGFGFPYRTVPAATALPGGGALLIHEYCERNFGNGLHYQVLQGNWRNRPK